MPTAPFPVLDLLAINTAAIAVSMLLLWLLSVALRDASIVDIFWGAGFALVAAIGLAYGEGAQPRRALIAGMTLLWGLRLAAYLFWRNAGHGEDVRYQAMRRHHGERFWLKSLGTVFGLQGLLVLIVSLPVQMTQSASGPAELGLLDGLGVVLFAAGLFFESVGDAQLARFKADPENAGQVMNRGLWAWTRHPNYFGDFLVWWGIFAVSVSTFSTHPVAALGIVGPLVMSFLLMRVSGVPLLERRLVKTRPGYAEYAARTPAFFPRPPRAEK